MGTIPGFLLRHTITIEPYLGHNATGPMYGPAVTVRCFNEDKRRFIRSGRPAGSTGSNEVVASTTSYCLPGTVAPAQSRVTVNGRVTKVLQFLDHDGGGLPTPDHVELLLE
jgi:hypothetical protein